MPTIPLKYGRGSIELEDGEHLTVLGGAADAAPLSDAELGARLEAPIDTPQIEEIVGPGDSVLLVVPDATRQAAAGQVVNLLVRRLIANGSAPHEIRIIFATGIHRRVTESEKAAILTPFVAQRITTLDHDPRDLARIVRLGETSDGIPIELDRAVLEYDHMVILGGVTFHYFAGFTGGRKLICPGLASKRTVSETHRLAFDLDKRTRRAGVGTGLLEGNAVHEAFVEVVKAAPPAFAISTIVNDRGEATDLFCGDWITSHRRACEEYANRRTIVLAEKRDLVIVSCGGSPHDINMIQAHKALDMAAKACTDGGTIVLVAACAEGLGRADFLSWFDAADSEQLGERLAEKYQVNGQTAWSLLRKAERFRVKIVTELDDAMAQKMRLEKIDAASLSEICKGDRPGYVFTAGAKDRISIV